MLVNKLRFLKHHIFYIKSADLMNLSKLLQEKYKTLHHLSMHIMADAKSICTKKDQTINQLNSHCYETE